jgi:protein-L-isoaspartate(D-aspartate) O-methyltransferase
LRLDDRQSADVEALGRALNYAACHLWLGVNATEAELGHFEFWLATLDGFCRLIASSDELKGRLIEPMYRWGSMDWPTVSLSRSAAGTVTADH